MGMTKVSVMLHKNMPTIIEKKVVLMFDGKNLNILRCEADSVLSDAFISREVQK